MVLTLRILLLFTVALFWGGLTFYTGFVVRISHDILNDPMDGGLITQRVTSLLQWLAAISVIPMAINAMVIRRHSVKFGNALLLSTGVFGCAVVGLFIVHQQLDSVIDISQGEVTDAVLFETGHRSYNRLTTIEWLATVAYLPLTIWAWKSLDSAPFTGPPETKPSTKKPLESDSTP